MVKIVGGVRPLSRGGVAYQNRLEEYRGLMESGDYSTGYFSEKGGGYFIVEDSTFSHKTEEFEAARHLADSGYNVTLTNEAGKGDGVKSPDGKLFKASFEQRTPDRGSVKNCLYHARDKKAEMAVIYDKSKIYHRADIDAGIKDFEEHSKYRFKKIIVIESNGKVHTRKHN